MLIFQYFTNLILTKMSFQSEENNPNNSHSWTSFFVNHNSFDNCSQASFFKTKDDQQFVTQWISNLPSQPAIEKPSANIDISGMKQLMKKVIKACEEIRHLETVLRKSVSNLSDTEWSQCLNQIEKLQKEISENSSFLDQNICKQIKSVWMKRISKRARQRKKTRQRRAKRLEEKKLLELNLKRIEDELKKQQRDLECKKKEEEDKKLLDNVLRDVNKRKATARKYISLIDALLKLREAREKSALGRGERVNAQMAKDFVYNIGELKKLWQTALNDYVEEEIKIKNKLQVDVTRGNVSSLSNTVETDVDQESAARLWKSTLFGGENVMPQRNLQHASNFISLRDQWDRYVSIDEGTSLPVGWVMPPSLPSNEWSLYQQ